MTPQVRARASREAKLEALQEQLSEAVSALVTGEDWKRALTFAAQFRSRSFNNTMLIYAQHYSAYNEGRVPDPTPTYVAGFHQWLSLGRHVQTGQQVYRILAPVTARFASTNPADATSWRRLARGEKPGHGEIVKSKLVGLKPAHVWDVSQTAGDPVPEPPRPDLLQVDGGVTPLCLAEPGRTYLVYLEGRATVRIATTATLSGEWINAQKRADREPVGRVSPGTTLTPPARGDDWILVLRSNAAR